MAYSEERLYQGQPGTGETTLYTVPTTLNSVNVKRVQVTEIVVCNTTTNNAAISLSIVPSGGTAGAANRILATANVNGNTTQTMTLREVMYVGDFISGLQGISGAITVTISGMVKS